MQFTQQSSDKGDIKAILKSGVVSLGFLVESYIDHISFIHQTCYSENSNIVIYLEIKDGEVIEDLVDTFMTKWYEQEGSFQSSPYNAHSMYGAVVILGSG